MDMQNMQDNGHMPNSIDDVAPVHYVEMTLAESLKRPDKDAMKRYSEWCRKSRDAREQRKGEGEQV